MQIMIAYTQLELEYIIREHLERTYNITRKNPMTITWDGVNGITAKFDGDTKREDPFGVEE